MQDLESVVRACSRVPTRPKRCADASSSSYRRSRTAKGWTHVAPVLVRGSNGQPLCWQGVMVDVSTQRGAASA